MRPPVHVAALFILALSVVCIVSASSSDSSSAEDAVVEEGAASYHVAYDGFFNGTVTSVECGSGSILSMPESLDIGEAVVTIRSIASGAFDGCSIAEIRIPRTVDSIGDGAFSGCSGLKKITIDQGNDSYANDGSGMPAVFSKNKRVLVAYPAAANRTNETIPYETMEIRPRAFENALNLRIVTFSANSLLSAIPSKAFMNCDSLTDVHIGNANITSIGDSAFRDCAMLSNIVFDGAGIASIGDDAFRDCKKLESIRLPGSIKSIGDRAFMGGAMERIVMEEGLESIGAGAFKSCSALTSATLPRSLESIGAEAFHSCAGLKSLNLGDTSIERIESNTFSRCNSLGSIVIPAGVSFISPSAFYECRLHSISVADGNGSYVSRDGILFDAGMRELISYPSMRRSSFCAIPSGIERIGDYAFSLTDGIVSASIPSSVETIGAKAFEKCYNLETVDIEDGSLEVIGRGAFAGCTKLSSIAFPSGVSIEASAFEWCTGLLAVRIPSDADVEVNAFINARNIVSVSVGEGATVKPSAFSGRTFDSADAPSPGTSYAGDSVDMTGGKCMAIYLADGSLHGEPTLYSIGDAMTIADLPVMEGRRYSPWTVDGEPVSGAFAIVETMLIESESAMVVGASDITGSGDGCTMTIDGDGMLLTEDAIESMGGIATIEFDDAVVVMDADALKRISGGSEVSFKLSASYGIPDHRAISGLDEKGRMIASDALVLSIDVIGDGVASNLGTVRITVPYTLPNGVGADGISAYFISEDGSLEELQASYEGGHVTFETTHFSDFAICESLGNGNPYYSGDDDDTILFIAAGSAVVLLAAAFIGVHSRKRR